MQFGLKFLPKRPNLRFLSLDKDVNPLYYLYFAWCTNFCISFLLFQAPFASRYGGMYCWDDSICSDSFVCVNGLCCKQRKMLVLCTSPTPLHVLCLYSLFNLLIRKAKLSYQYFLVRFSSRFFLIDCSTKNKIFELCIIEKIVGNLNKFKDYVTVNKIMSQFTV